MRDNSLTSSIVKTADKPPEAGDLSPDLCEAGVKPPGPQWSPLPLQLSSYNLGQPPALMAKPRPALRTETLERHPGRRPSLRTFTSGRASAEPLDSLGPRSGEARAGLAPGAHTSLVSALPSSLSELDLR